MWNDTPAQLAESRAALADEIRTLADLEHITPAQDRRLDEALIELSRLDSQIAGRAQFDEGVARGFPPRSIYPSQGEPSWKVNKRTNPFDTDELRHVAPEKRAAEMRGRAVDVIASHTGRFDHVADVDREHTTRLLEESDDVSHDVAEYVIATGAPDYSRAFSELIRNPRSVTARMQLETLGAELEARTALTTAGASGAIHAPYWLDPSLIVTNAGIVDPMRAVSRSATITGTDKWTPPFTSGVTAGYIGENAAFTDNTPTFTSTSIQTYQAGAWVLASFQSAEDSNVARELGMLFADAKQRFEGGQFATGPGSSAMQGIAVFASNATSVVAGSSGAANAAELVPADIYGLREALSARWRPNGTWMASLPIAHKIRQLGDSQVGHAFSLDLTESDDALRLLGRPFYENSSLDSTIVSGSTDDVIIHGDFSQFMIVNRLGVTLNYLPVFVSGGAPQASSAWVAHWRTGSGGLVADAFRMARL
jgi:HK97 family phage major capsid protein